MFLEIEFLSISRIPTNVRVLVWQSLRRHTRGTPVRHEYLRFFSQYSVVGAITAHAVMSFHSVAPRGVVGKPIGA